VAPARRRAGKATLRDTDPKDSPEKPWPRPASGRLTVHFVPADASTRYARLLEEAAAIWSRGSSVTAVASSSPPAGAHHVRVVEKKRHHRHRKTDGEFSGDDHHGVRRGGTITLYTHLLDRATDNGALATIVHEMGHAFGLVHRRNKHDVMHADTDDDTDPVPDEVDFANLETLYGGPAGRPV
jgi:hypothetical protein